MKSSEYYRMIVEAVEDGVLPGYEGGSCKYLTNDGRRCVVGLLMSGPELAHKEGFSGLPEELKASLIRRVDGSTGFFFDSLQSAHDLGAVSGEWNPRGFLSRVRRIFDECGLQTDESEGCDRVREAADSPLA